ncbi:unnamed protein product [Albugo candida]|uniref:Uncharacterized protein n=1 Tax=Albugo candida TaxID=65357 RepID=A0A024GJS5_9STRA|nr:unnamed protein product [Albugo candida]|eukprot:CCI46772.1 unnamed protein product [Albugo candida]
MPVSVNFCFDSLYAPNWCDSLPLQREADLFYDIRLSTTLRQNMEGQRSSISSLHCAMRMHFSIGQHCILAMLLRIEKSAVELIRACTRCSVKS